MTNLETENCRENGCCLFVRLEFFSEFVGMTWTFAFGSCKFLMIKCESYDRALCMKRGMNDLSPTFRFFNCRLQLLQTGAIY